jgi:PhnB protein
MAYHPYLFFGGNCREAFTRYHEIFGGDLTLLTAADMPAEQRPPEDTGDMIMHAALVGEGGALLMGSDDPTTDSFGPVQGMQVNFATPDVDEAKRVFAALADGGTVHVEPSDTGWSPYFGMLSDRFGTPWMIGADAADQAG